MKIPKKFKIFNQEIKIIFEEDLQQTKDIWGECRVRTKTIAIDNNIDQGYKEQVFCHELVHLILEVLREEELSKNEKLVDLMGHCLHQIICTMEY